MHSKFIVHRSFAGLLAMSLAFSGCAGSHSRIKSAKPSEGEIVEAEGTAPYSESDVPGMRAAAIAAAQRAAVELVVGVYVTAKTKVDKAVEIEQTILTNTSGYVKKYEVISEGRSGEWYKVRIRALVLANDVRNQLNQMGLLQKPVLAHPRVAVLLQEYIGEKPSDAGYAKRALEQVLLNLGFKVVDLPSGVNAAEEPSEIAKGLSKNAAEIVIAGMARAESMGPSKNFGGMSSYRSVINFRVLETGTSEVLATVSEVASGLEATPDLAAQKSLQLAANQTSKDLSSLPQQLTERAHYEVTISGLKSFELLEKFEHSLAEQSGIQGVYLRSFDQDSGVAAVDVLTDELSAPDLADRCVQLGGQDWSVYQVSGRSIQLSATLAGR